MRVLIFTSSGGTAHDAAAYALKAWLQRWDPKGEVWVEHVLENASVFTRAGVALYNWIQRHGPWMHRSIGVLWSGKMSPSQEPFWLAAFM